jgi:O-succinylbenzoic acid--CoA ligase
VRWSFETLNRQASRTARQLASLGIVEGSRAALLLPNSAAFVTLMHALARLGAVTVPLNTRLTPPELAWQLADAGAELLITGEQLRRLAAEAARDLVDLRRVIIGDPPELHGLIREPDGSAVAEARVPLRDTVDLAAVQGIIYTSATSGRPKGVLLTHGNHWWSAIGSALRLGLRDDDRWLAALPFHHVGGVAILWRSVIYGIPAVIHQTFDAGAVNHEIDTGGITIVSVVSTMLERILAARGNRPFPASLRCILLGGGPIPRSLLAECAGRGAPVAVTYGLTEAASQVATLVPGQVAQKPGSCGEALLPTQIRIDLDGRAGEPGDIGEVLVAGPTVMQGYAGRPEETARALRDGWLHTGDLGYLDSEGYLYILDRRDDLIVTGGENVYPAEVEAVLREHPAVADAGVIGLPDPTWGQTVAAVVAVREPEHMSKEDVEAFCAARLAKYKIPRQVWFMDALPRSPGGKLLRSTLREWAAQAAARGRTPAG